MHRSTGFLAAGLPLAFLLATACTPADPAQDATAGTASHPDFSGVWMAFAVENPDGGGNAPRYSAEGEAKLRAFAEQFSEIPETGAWCVGAGMPGVMLSLVSYPIELVQTASRIVMVAELETQVRRVFLDGREFPDDYPPAGVGYSIGTWDGDTLVIDTRLLEEWWLRPWPRSEQTRIVERVRLTKLANVGPRPTGFVATVQPPINDDVLVIDMTLTDPTLYDGPQRRIAYYQRMDDSATLEYGCSKGLWHDELERHRIAE
ncbi:MAG TPA: hypothetical protein VIN61_14595 [Gammaproteobacteria bacterium]